MNSKVEIPSHIIKDLILMFLFGQNHQTLTYHKQKFSVNMRNIFKETTISFKSAKQARRWLSGPDFRYWPQQLNFVVWCATSGCGISLKEAKKYGVWFC